MYILERHIARYDALRPGARCSGVHKNEKYWQRADVKPLHTAERCPPLGSCCLLMRPLLPRPSVCCHCLQLCDLCLSHDPCDRQRSNQTDNTGQIPGGAARVPIQDAALPARVRLMKVSPVGY